MPINNPNDIPDLVLWKEARLISGLSQDDPVADWDGGSGSLTQPTAGLRPVYHDSGGPSNEPFVKFNASLSQQMQCSMTLGHLTIVAVARQRAGGAKDGIIFGNNATNVQIRVGRSGANVISLFVAGVWEAVSDTLPVDLATWSVLGWLLDDSNGGNALIRFRQDDQEVSFTGDITPTANKTYNRLGNVVDALFLDYDVAKVFVYGRRITDTEYADLLDYIANPPAGSPPTPGVCSASLTSQWEVTIDSTGATSGTPPYTAQVQRSSDTDGDPTGDWVAVGSPQTGLTANQAITTVLDDVTALQNQIVHYRVLWTDDALQSAGSNTVPILVRFGATYYIDATAGSDANDGLSEVNAWQTISKVNTWRATKGDTFKFKGTFASNLRMRLSVGGVAPTSTERVTVNSFGGTKAIIQPGDSYGVWLDTIGHVIVEDMEIEGPGVTLNDNSPNPFTITYGIAGPNLWSTRIDNAGIRIDNEGGAALPGVIVRNNHVHGIAIGIRAARQGNVGVQAFGYDDLTIEDNTVEECLLAGIAVTNENQSTTVLANRGHFLRPVVQRNLVRNIYGSWDGTDGEFASGFGIEVWNATDLLIKHNVIVECGQASQPGIFLGPTGIIVAFSLRDTLDEHVVENIVAAQHTQDAADGFGIDVESGVNGIRIRRNYIVDCDGAGLGWGDGTGAFGDFNTTNCEFSYNVVQNCGRKHLNGFIREFNHQGGSGNKFFNNTYFCNIASKPAFEVDDIGHDLRNNCLIFRSGATFGGVASTVPLQGNLYDFAGGSTFSVVYNGTHASIADLRTAGGEMVGATPVGIEGPAGLVNAGGGPTTGFTINSRSYDVGDYDPLDETSNVVGNGLDLETLFGYDIGTTDFRQVTLSGTAIGAVEMQAAVPSLDEGMFRGGLQLMSGGVS